MFIFPPGNADFENKQGPGHLPAEQMAGRKPITVEAAKQMKRYLMVLVVGIAGVVGCKAPGSGEAPAVMTGLDRVVAGEVSVLDGLRVGVITNQTGRTAAGRHIADVIMDDPDITLVALFGPEHGIRGKAEAGDKVSTGHDNKTGVPVYSLYGATRKPAPEMLAGLDALVFDIQDIGARFYTYISTMSLAMEAAAENDLRFIVLDRPNPIGGELVEGPVLDPRFRSFVGIHPIPVRHGMTVGELARMFNEQGWLAGGVRAELTVIPMRGWKRHMLWQETGLPWVAPSPNIPDAETALLYPGIGLLEMTNVSEGRGTRQPFILFGSPWMSSSAMISRLRQAGLQGVRFSPASFTPVDIPGMATRNKFDGRLCNGVRISVEDGHQLRSVRLGMHVLTSLQALYPDSLRIWQRRVERMLGRDDIWQALMENVPADTIIARWQPGREEFLEKRARSLLYE